MAQMTDSAVTGLTVFALSDTEWRISDAARPESDGLAVLAFVELVDSLYEVTELERPWRRTYFSSLTAVVEMLSPAMREA
jgi:hypothetical protein